MGLDSDTVITIAINSLDHILAGTMSGHVYISRDNGDSWNDYSSGLNTTQVRCIVLDENDFAMVGTANSGVYRSANSTVDVEDFYNPMITSFELFQNFPNPFNPSTTIKYSIPQSSQVVVKVFDILGNEITILVDENKPAGRYEVEFSAKGGSASGGNAYSLPSGVYFYRIQAGSFIDTKKMILLK